MVAIAKIKDRKCPQCGRPAIKRLNLRYSCINGHRWRDGDKPVKPEPIAEPEVEA